MQVRRDDSLTATVVSRRPLVYDDAAHGHVRAGSAVARLGARLAIVQDDANAIALVDAAGVRAIPLPDGRGALSSEVRPSAQSKATKLDLEACVVADERLVAFGSGSTPARERIAVVEGREARVLAAGSFYEALRRDLRFSGGSLNVEGALLRGDTLVLFQRGNGARTATSTPVNATCEVAWGDLWRCLTSGTPPPRPRNVTQYELGEIDGVPLSFTDATLAPGGGVVFLAAAEGSPNTYDDGPVVGVAVGILEPGPPRLTILRDASGAPLLEKAEGITFDPARPAMAHVVVDRDDPSVACDLLEVVLGGFG